MYKCKLLLLGAIFTVLFVAVTNNIASNSSSKQQLTTFLLLIITAAAITTASLILYYYRYVLYCLYNQQTFIWMDPTVVSINRLEMKVHTLRLHSSVEKARIAALQPNPVDDSPNVWLLDPLQNWKFRLFHTVQDALQGMKNERKGSSKGCWSPVKIPGHWMLDARFNDRPIYTNQKYPFMCQPPFVPHENPTGIYKLDIPSGKDDWFQEDYRYTVMIHGIESAAYVYWNYEFVGFMKDSRLPSEFVVKHPSQAVNNVLHVLVIRWSDGSYLEDQDQWWFAGIHRSIELRRYPVRRTLIDDYHVVTTHDGQLDLNIKLRRQHNQQQARNNEDDSYIIVRVYEDEQLSPDGSQYLLTERPVWSSARNHLSEDDENQDAAATTTTTTTTTTLKVHNTIPDIKQWTAETPNLYTLVIELYGGNYDGGADEDVCEHNIIQCESCRIGFRTVSIDTDGEQRHHQVLKVNNKPIMIRGINRHEHDPDTGKVISLERTIQDITLFK
jgi:beta-galactosidase